MSSSSMVARLIMTVTAILLLALAALKAIILPAPSVIVSVTVQDVELAATP